MMNLNAVLLFFRKDIVDMLFSRRTGYLIVFMPIITIIFRLIFLAGTDDPVVWRVIMINGEDLALTGDMAARSTFEIIPMTDEAEARDLLLAEKKDAILIFPENTAELLAAGTVPPVRMIFNQAQSLEPAVFEGYIRAVLTEAAGLTPPPLEVEYVGLSAASSVSNYGSEAFSMQFSLMALAFVALVGLSVNLLEEREARTLDAALIGPLHMRDILAGKVLVTMFYSLLSALLTVMVYPPVQVNWPMLAMVMLLTLPFLIGVGLWMGLASEDLHQCNIWGSVISMLIILSAFIRMIDFSQSSVLSVVASLLPGTPTVDGLRVALTDGAWPEMLRAMWPQALWTAGAVILVMWGNRIYQQRKTASVTV